MAYDKLTTVANVQKYFIGKDFTSGTSKPSETTINEWIDIVTTIIYGKLKDKYVVPVTDACDLLVLQELADLYVRTKITGVIGKANPKTVVDGKLVPVSEDQSEFWKRLEMIANCEIQLPNSTLESTQLMSYSYNQRNDIEPVAEKYTDQW